MLTGAGSLAKLYKWAVKYTSPYVRVKCVCVSYVPNPPQKRSLAAYLSDFSVAEGPVGEAPCPFLAAAPRVWAWPRNPQSVGQ